jgi:hypothetical protein
MGRMGRMGHLSQMTDDSSVTIAYPYYDIAMDTRC